MSNTSIIMTAAMLFALFVAAVLGLPESARAQGSSADAKRPESPIACNRLALTAEQRKRHFDELGPKLLSLKKGFRELPNGYEFEFPPDSNTVAARRGMGSRRASVLPVLRH